MGFFLQRSLRLGLLRFNLSKSGVGISAGVKGLRAGVDPKGRGYVAGGRGWLYFRERIPPAPSDRARGTSAGRATAWLIVAAITVAVMLALIR